VARFTSPHLVDFRERIVIDGTPVDEADVSAFVQRWLPTADALGATFFEITTALAFDRFARSGVDVAVIETGLGGRLDSTNVVAPVVAGVTAIGLDHTELLGDTREQIAWEKGGIYKPGVPAVVGEPDPGIRGALAHQAAEAGASAVRVVADECRISEVAVSAHGTSFRLEAPFGEASMVMPLPGAFQAHNAATALTMLDAAGDPWRMPLARSAEALGTVRLAGRFQRVGRWLFDVAHNPDGARVLAETLAALRPDRPVAALVTVLADKDWRGMLEALAPAVDLLVLSVAPTAPPGRVWPLGAAGAYAAGRGWDAVAEPDFDRALALAAQRGRTVLVTGSFHTVGDAMLRLQVDPLAR
jgi:dihydrofolate synthase/folylpolyglutamate synthase